MFVRKTFGSPQRLFITASLALCLFGMVLSVAQASGTVKVKYYSNLRAGPGTSYAVVGSAAPGDVFAVHATSGKWIRVGAGKWIAGWLTNMCYEPDQVCEAIGATGEKGGAYGPDRAVSAATER